MSGVRVYLRRCEDDSMKNHWKSEEDKISSFKFAGSVFFSSENFGVFFLKSKLPIKSTRKYGLLRAIMIFRVHRMR